MFDHDISLMKKFLREQPDSNRASRKDTDHSNSAEKVQRPSQITQQEANRQQIEEHAEGAGNAVMRGAALSIHVLDRYFDNGCAVPRRQGWNKAMHLSVQRHLFENFPAIGFEGRSEIMNIHAAQ